ncbi:mariner Mos1 transposase [Trichonephila clavipes]|nr:mariner Mos1 transposase [Trichonephila clavipes]
MIPAYKKKGCAAFHSRREFISGESSTSFTEDTSMPYSGFEPEPARLHAECHNHYTDWVACVWDFCYKFKLIKLTNLSCMRSWSQTCYQQVSSPSASENPSCRGADFIKPGETVNTDQAQLLNLKDAILEKREQYKKQQYKVIFLDDNLPSNRAKPTKDIVKALGWEPLANAAYSPDLAPSDYHLFASLGHALAEQRFTSYENVKYWLED